MGNDADGHELVLRWSHVLGAQVERLRAQRLALRRHQAEWLARGTYTHEDKQPFYMLAAEAHFTVLAAHHLCLALSEYDGDLRLSEGLEAEDIATLRHALEHWNDEDGRSQIALAIRDADPRSNQWAPDGSGLVGDIVDDDLLWSWAAAVYQEFRRIDPPPPRSHFG